MNKRMMAISIAMASMVMTSGVQASLVIETSSSKRAPEVARKASSFSSGRTPLDIQFMVGVRPGEDVLVSQQGRPIESLTRIDGFGSGVRFVEALSQVIPNGWQIYTEGEIPLNKVMSWEGNRNWAAVLNSMMNTASDSQTRLEAVIDWQSREMLISAKPRHGALDASQVAANAQSGPLFRLDAGKSLSENLTQWVEREGWMIVWLAPVDYAVSSSRVYQGELVAEGGALEQVISEYFGARVPLSVRMDANKKVIEVMQAPL